LFRHTRHKLLLLQRGLLSIPILGVLGGYGIVLFLRRFVDLRVGGPVESIGADTVQLETDTSRTWPSVGRCSIALDLSSAASLTSSHNWKQADMLVPALGDVRDMEAGDGPYPSSACVGCAHPQRHSLR
jgi:hypothetical protein